MSNEKRFISFVIVVFLWMIASSYLSRMMGWNPPPRKPAVVADRGKDIGEPPKPNLAKADAEPVDDGDRKAEADQTKKDSRPEDKPSITAAPTKPDIELVDPSELVLGSLTDKSSTGYLIEAQLEQKGAGIESVHSSRYDAELGNDFNRWNPRKRPLALIARDPGRRPSLSLTLSPGSGRWLQTRPRQPMEEPMPTRSRLSERPLPRPKTCWIRYSGKWSAMKKARSSVRSRESIR